MNQITNLFAEPVAATNFSFLRGASEALDGIKKIAVTVYDKYAEYADTIAAILGAMLGACAGVEHWPSELIQQVKAVNNLQLEPLVQQLLTLRSAS